MSWYHVTPLLVVNAHGRVHPFSREAVWCPGPRTAELVISTGATAVVSNDDIAAKTLRLLGLTEAEISDRISFGKSGVTPTGVLDLDSEEGSLR